MDWSSIGGLALALGGIFLGQILEGGHLGSILQPTAFLIVFAGTVGAVLLQTRLDNFVRGVKLIGSVFSPPDHDHRKLIEDITLWSTVSRREGLLHLEEYLDSANDPFVKKGLRLLIDGITPAKMLEILEVDISTYETRQRQAMKIWEAAGGYSPTIGILGAVLGLIHVMENLADPARLGGGIAVAFVATIYGVGLANLFFLPVGNKLKELLAAEVTKREMIADSLFGIASGDNPRVIQERAESYFENA
ncbi:flagellar motor protein [Herbaspirillum rhizosphaerae]|uniref:flagellar motor protein n=1 Tax=Herbaspirillum rhizosphaerae TaxID=346179 RepID=UPI00067D92A6|nr:flagellar motor protein [Herbaspirillum rhizosphaerae]